MVLISRAFVGLVAVLSFGHVDAFWRMVCGTIRTGRVDPIISPGTISGHCHTIAGPININISSTYDTLQDAYCTSCEIQQDKSGYWTPQMYYKHSNGTFEEVPHTGTVVYYEGRGVNTSNITAFPPGFRVLSGNSGARSYDANTLTYLNTRPVADRVSFACLDSSGPIPEQPYMARTDCDDGLRAQIQFQTCWDGINLYKSDQSHVAYLSDMDNGYCPPGYPVLFMHLFFEVLYSVNSIDTSDGGFYVFGNGDTTGYGFHGDFINGWDMDVQRAAIAQCATTDSGAIADCAPLYASDDPYFNINCPEQPPIFNETVHGLLKVLPGCNPPTGGAALAPQNVCPVQPSINYNNNNYNFTRVIPYPGLLIGNWSYVGCSLDMGSTRALGGPQYSSTSGMTIESCTAYCQSQGYLYSGLEYSTQCYCGSYVDPSQPILNVSTCADIPFMVCSGNGLEYCGGPSILQVWNNTQYTGKISTGPPVPGVSTLQLPSTGSATYQGCYAEGVGSRALNGTSFTNSLSMTLELCAAFCQQGRYSLFGLEYYDECYCSAYPVSTAQIGERNCSYYCVGDSTEFCGAGSKLSVWSLNYTNYVPQSTTTAAGTAATSTGAGAALPSSTVRITVAGGTGVYLGCISDSTGSRSLSAYYFNNATMTNDQCAAICQGMNYALFGTEYTTQCYCANMLASTTQQLAASSCNIPCGGNKTQTCGGNNAISLYNNTLYSPTRIVNPAVVPGNSAVSYNYTGCYVDNVSGHALAAYGPSSISPMTVEVCAGICFNQGYNYMGVEYAVQCFCSNAAPGAGSTLAANGDAACTAQQCSGDITEYCGGGNRLLVYKRNGS